MDYSDIPYLTRWSRILGLSGKDSKNITIDLNYTITQFFNTYLKNKDDNWLKKIDDNYTITKRIKRK